MAILDSSKTYIDGVDIVSGQDITDTQDTAIYAKNTVNKLSGGTYDPTKTYEYPNIVEKDGSSYMYINRTPSAGVTPPNANYWQLIASASTAEGGGSGVIIRRWN